MRNYHVYFGPTICLTISLQSNSLLFMCLLFILNVFIVHMTLLLKGNSNKNNTSSIWRCWFNMFQIFLQIFVSFLIYKISRFVWKKMHSVIHSICIPPSWIFISIVGYPWRHNLVKIIMCLKGVSGHFHNRSCSFTFFCSTLRKSLV